MIFLAFYYQFFTLHDRQFSYLSLPLLLASCLNAGQLILAFSAIFVKKIYRTPFLVPAPPVLSFSLMSYAR